MLPMSSKSLEGLREAFMDALATAHDEETHDQIIERVQSIFDRAASQVSALSTLASLVEGSEDDDTPSLIVRSLFHLEGLDGVAQHHRVGLLVKMLRHSDHAVRIAAAKGLDQIRARETLKELRNARDAEPVPVTRSVMTHIVDRWTGTKTFR